MSDTKIKTSNIGNLAVTHALLHTDMDLTSKTVQVATPTSNTHPATKAYVDTEVANLIDTAPSTLDTLNELAAALGDDADFSNTITGSIATKLPLAGGTMTGVIGGFESTGIDDNASATAITILSNGNVGIGTDSPSRTLDVRGSVRFSVNTTTHETFVFTTQAVDDAKLIMKNASSVDNIILRANGNSYFNGGNVGIGTNNPSGKLHAQTSHTSTDVTTANSNETLVLGNSGVGNGVYNALRFGGNQQDMYIMSFNNGQVADRRLGFFLGSVAGDAVADERLSILGNGNVGIGTTSPAALLHLKSTANSVGPSLIFENTNNAQSMNIDYYNNGGAVQSRIQYAEGPASFNFIPNVSNGNSALYIAYDGKVGIGTTSPGYKLSVDNGTSDGGIFKLNNEEVGLNVSVNGGVGDYTNSTRMVVFNATRFDGGAAPKLRLGGQGGIEFAADANSVRMVVGSNGNVGIGEATAPVAPLDIFPGSTNGTMYDALVLRGGANSTQGSGVRLHMSGTGNDALSRGVILQSEMTNNGNNHDFSVWTSQASAHTKKFTIDNQGQVAIGANAPSGTRLHIQVPNSGSGLTDAVKIDDSSGYAGIAMYVGAADGEIRLGSAGQLRGKISGAGVGSRSDHNFDLYQNSNIVAGLRSSINGTGRRGLHMLGNSLGFDQSGVRSWEMRAADGNLRVDSGDGYGKVQVNAGFKAKSIQLGNDSANSTFGAQSGYIGDWWEAGHKAVYYLGYLGSSASTPGTANWFNFYTSGHWGQYTRVMVYSFNHYPAPGYSKWDINGTTVTQVEGRGSVGSVTSTQSTVSSNGHSGQPVYKYTVQLTMPDTYTQGPWFVALLGGGGGGHLSNARTDAQADSWFSIRGGGMHLRNITTDAMKTSPMYVAGT